MVRSVRVLGGAASSGHAPRLPPIALILNWRGAARWASQLKGYENWVLWLTRFPRVAIEAFLGGVGRRLRKIDPLNAGLQTIRLSSTSRSRSA
jgi:putative exporter of polyketide antibiotics